MREYLMILFVTLSTLGSQLLVKNGVRVIAKQQPPPQGLSWLWAAVTSPSVIGAVAIQGVGFLVWVVISSRMKLGAAFAISGAFFYILVALSSWLLYDERLTPLQWGGLVLISTGAVLMLSSST